jgi:hypothetical protein
VVDASANLLAPPDQLSEVLDTVDVQATSGGENILKGRWIQPRDDRVALASARMAECGASIPLVVSPPAISATSCEAAGGPGK